MSIKEDRAEIKSLTRDIGSKHRVYEDTETQIIEEEFDIVPKNGSRSLFSRDNFLVGMIIVLIGTLSYGVGRISTIESHNLPIKITNPVQGDVKGVSTTTSIQKSKKVDVTPDTPAKTNISSESENLSSVVVASKSSTKYHYPWCSGAKRIAPKNLITFSSIDEARKAGLTPAANCKGLK